MSSQKVPNSLDAIKRRQVGKREWKMSIQEVLESERSDIRLLRRLRNKHSDSETQQIIAQILEEKAERIITLTELLHYRDTEQLNRGG